MSSRKLKAFNELASKEIHYHLKISPIYGDKTIKLCSLCPLSIKNDEVRQTARHIELVVLSEKNMVQASNCYIDKDKQISMNDVSQLDIKAIDLSSSILSNRQVLTELPREMFQFSFLKRLHLDGNQIEELPESIGKRLKKLEVLTCSNNRLRKLPESLNSLKHLCSLHLSHNNFTHFPEIICELTSLRFLDICSNMLSEISSNINNLVCLETLLISNNKLKCLPESIDKIKCLKTLWIEGNDNTFENRDLPTGAQV